MKKILGLLIGFIITFSTTVFAASEPMVSFTVDGKVEKGEKIIINIIAKDVSNLYALSADYIYNPEFMKVNSIEGANLIKDSKDNLMEPGGQVDKDGNRANYQMTFTGKVNGVSGSGPVVKIEAEVLKDFTMEVTEENMKVKLVKVDADYNVDRMSFVFNSFKTEGNATDKSGGTSSTETSSIETSGDTSSEENKAEKSDGDLGVTSSDEAEKKLSNQGFGSSDGETLKGDNKGIEKNSENNVGENKEVASSKTNIGVVILTASIFIMVIGGAVALVRKKRIKKKIDIENSSEKK